MIERDVVADGRCLADHDACAVVDEESRANGRAGMNVYVCQKARKPRQEPREPAPAAPPGPAGDPVPYDCVHARVGRKDFEFSARSRIAAGDTADVATDLREQACHGHAVASARRAARIS